MQIPTNKVKKVAKAINYLNKPERPFLLRVVAGIGVMVGGIYPAAVAAAWLSEATVKAISLF